MQQQTAKLAAALVALDADIVGLIGVENNGFGESSAIVQLVSAVNTKLPEAKKYRIVKKILRTLVAWRAATMSSIALALRV